MNRNHIIVLAIAVFVFLWMYSQSGNASTDPVGLQLYECNG